jgi:predicted nucleotide-binding protein (sugar kinase/HSP70/actin superfamily)
MKQIENKQVLEVFELIDDLEKMLTERISELHEVKGMMQQRHVFCYYRKLLWSAKYILRDNLIETPKPKVTK